MKSIMLRTLALGIYMLSIQAGLEAQQITFRSGGDQNSTEVNIDSVLEVKKSPIVHNIIRFTPGKLLYGGIAGSYERAIGSKLSVGIGFQLIQPASLDKDLLRNHPLGNILLNQGILPEGFSLNTAHATVDTGSVSGMLVTPELRFYPGFVGSPYGFYFMAFGRYMNYTGEASGNYQNGNTMGGIDVALSMSGIGGGIGIGTQHFIANRISIDWHIGVGIVLTQISLKGEAQGNLAPQTYIDELNAAFSELPYIKSHVNLTQQSAEGPTIDAIAKTNWMVFKSGLSIGVAF